MAGTVTTDLQFFQGASTTSACESATGWSGVTVATDSDANIEGTYCIGAKVSTGTTSPLVYTLNAAQNVTGQNMYAWVTGQKLGQWDSQANGGIRMRVDDSTRYAEWYVAGSDTIPHQGWICHTINFIDTLSAAIAEYPQNTFTDQTTAANNTTTNDMNVMRPSASGTPATNDAYYFGHREPFRMILFYLSTVGAGTWAYTWEYYNGSSWTALSGVTDGTSNYTQAAPASGVNIRRVTYTLPTDWYPTTVNSQGPYYYIRSRLSSYTSVTTRPLGLRAWLRFGATPNRAGVISGDTNDSIEPNYSAITKVGFRLTLIAGLARTNCWFDAVRYGTKMTIYAGTAGSPGTFADFLTSESTNRYGLITDIEGVLNIQGKLEFGDSAGTNATYFADTNRHLHFRNNKLGSVANTLSVVGNASNDTEVIFGSLTTSGSNNLASGGLLIDSNYVTTSESTKWTLYCLDGNRTIIKFYGNTLRYAQRIYFGDANTKIDNVSLVGNSFESNGIIYYNLDSTETTSLNEQNTVTASTHAFATHIYELGNWRLNNITNNTQDTAYGLVFKSTAITFTLNSTTFAGNDNDVYFYQPSSTITLNLIDSTDNPAASQYSTNNWNLYEKTTYDLNVKNTAGSNLQDVSSQLFDNLGTEQYVGLTNASGNITTQYILRRTRLYTGSLATSTHNPYRLRIRKYDYLPQEISGKTFSTTAVADAFVLLADPVASTAVGTVSGWTGITVAETAALSAAVADDGGSQTNETTAANNGTTNDMTLLPATPAANDAYYFGGPFKFAAVKINFYQVGSGTWTLTWEYYNGASWSSLSGVTTPSYHSGAENFRPTSTGTKFIYWTLPTNWASTTIATLGPYYYVRARVSAYTSVTTQPKGTQSWLQDRIAVTSNHTLLETFEYLRYYTALTSPSHLSLADPITSADGTNFVVTDYAYLTDNASLSGASSILYMPTQDFYLTGTGSQALKKLTDIDGTQVTLTVTNVVQNTQCYIATTGGTELLNTTATTLVSGNKYQATAPYVHTVDTAVVVKAREMGYQNFETTGTITSDGLSVTAVWQVDTNWKLVVSGVNIQFTNPTTITRASGDFGTDGWLSVMGQVTVEGSVSNNGTYTLSAVGTTTVTITGATLTNEGPSSGITLTFTRIALT